MDYKAKQGLILLVRVSVHYSSGEQTNYYNELDGDYRIRSAGFFEKKEDAEQFVAETYSLYCSGPSAGGGARTSITKETSTASILVDRKIVGAPKYNN